MTVLDPHTHRPVLEAEALRDAMALSVWAGQMLLQHGADTQRVEKTIHHIGTGLGADWMDILVTPDSIVASTINNNEFRTKVRRAPTRGVNLAVIDAINRASHDVTDGIIDRHGLRQQLREIDIMPAEYNRWLVVLGVGLACASISRFFGGDAIAFLITFVAATLGIITRQELAKRHFNLIVMTIATAFVAASVSALAARLGIGSTPAAAISGSIILLVPGVPLINAAKDLISGYLLNGIARGVQGFIIVLGIAVGLTLAIWVMGVSLA